MSDSTKDRFLTTLNLIPGHAWYAGYAGLLLFINRQCADYLGVPPNDPLRSGEGMRTGWAEFIHPDDQDEVRTFWRERIESQSGGQITSRIYDAQGTYRYFLCNTDPLFTNEGALEGWIGVNVDIEQYTAAEFYLAEGQRLGQSGSWALNFNAESFQYWSPSLFQLHGLDETLKPPSIRQFLALVHLEDRNIVAREIEKMRTETRVFDFTIRIVRPDGEIRYLRWVGRSACRGHIGTGIDVTHQELLIKALRKSEEECRQILDFSPQHVAVIGPNAERHYANRTALDFLGISLEQWMLGSLGSQIHPDDINRYLGFFKDLSLETDNEMEVRVLKADGSYRWFLARYSPVRDDLGRPLRWYVTCTDIHERKRTEERLKQENIALREEIDRASMFEEIVGTSQPLLAVLSRITKVATSNSTVLISGETGTGKELVARAIHRRSNRCSEPFVAVNCAAIPQELIASELFGHEKGAFTGAMHRRIGRFELAAGGTIFLDEIGELMPDMQVALLRVLQERLFERVGGSETIHFDARIVAATNRNLEEAVSNGIIREDLFFRLNVFPLHVPPLRERLQDIPLLVDYFVDRYARKLGKTYRGIDERTLDRLKAYPWPGNVRELQNVIERSVIVCDSEEFMIDGNWLSSNKPVGRQLELPSTLATHEKKIIEEALQACGGRVFGPSGAAARLSIPRSTLESKIRALGIDKSRFR